LTKTNTADTEDGYERLRLSREVPGKEGARITGRDELTGEWQVWIFM